MEGEKMDSHGKVLKFFSPLEILSPPFSKERDFWTFSSFLFFFYASFPLFLCFIPLLRKNLGIFEIFEEETIFFFLSNGMEVAI
jgi:hypothetical protein